MTWDAQHVELLRTLAKDGLSAAQIARRMPADITRCAVIGKLQRLKIPLGGARPTDPASVKQRKRGNREQGAGRKMEANLSIATLIKKNPGISLAADPGPLRTVSDAGKNPVSLMEIKASGRCKYPVSDTPFLFCGDPSEGTYCPSHRKLCCIPVPQKVRKRT